MGDSRGRDEDCRAGRELDHHFPIPKDKMASLCVVVLAQCVDCAHAENQIVVVAVEVCPNVPAEVEGDGGKDAEGKGAEEGGKPEGFDLFLDKRKDRIDESEGSGRRKGVGC